MGGNVLTTLRYSPNAQLSSPPLPQLRARQRSVNGQSYYRGGGVAPPRSPAQAACFPAAALAGHGFTTRSRPLTR